MAVQKAPAVRVHVLFATVTGNAEEIARRIHAELAVNGLPQGVLCAVQDYAKSGLGTPAGAKDAFIFVASTTGDGDPPDTARPFMKFLRTKNAALLDNVLYAVLALGDTNYENFCRTGKRIDKALGKLGAVSFYPRGDADDGVGLEEVVEPWIAGLWPELRDAFNLPAPDTATETDAEAGVASPESQEQLVEDTVREVTDAELGFDETQLPRILPPTIALSVAEAAVDNLPSSSPSLSPFFDGNASKTGRVTGAKKLTSNAALKDVWHVEVTCDTAFEPRYRPGDAFGVLVENDASEVDRLFNFLKEAPTDVFQLSPADADAGAGGATATGVSGTGSVRRLLMERVDIRAVPKKTFLRALSRHCAARSERVRLLQLCSKDGRQQYTEQVLRKGMSTLEVLEKLAPSCRPPLSLLLDQLPPLAPRWYSAASAAAKDGDAVLHFAFSVVEKGLATTKLANMCTRFVDGQGGDDTLILVPRSSDAASHFHPPAANVPYVMVGPGTGVAPFRGFLREREAYGDLTAQTMLFFGCRTPQDDYLYREELEMLEAKSVVNVLDVAFSRVTETKVYVQDRMRQRAADIASVIQANGCIFVCGDGGAMAKAVDDALNAIVMAQICDGDATAAKTMLKQMAAEHRYVRDVWYFG